MVLPLQSVSSEGNLQSPDHQAHAVQLARRVSAYAMSCVSQSEEQVPVPSPNSVAMTGAVAVR